MGQVTTGKMGIKGHVVMPQKVRELLGVSKGSTIAWVITEDRRVEIRQLPEETLSPDEQEFAEALRAAGLSYDDWKRKRREHFDHYLKAKRKAK
jgi:bifunctional DNA-binding transcriptional regulator/antitoxin component of YhaV-PrlF toxin-antitoxin module